MLKFVVRNQPWVYVSSLALSAIVAWGQYPSLCLSNSNPCFRLWVANASMLIGCIGFLVLYLWKYLSERPSRNSAAPSTERNNVLPSIKVFGFAIVCVALGWLVGGGIAGFA